MATNNFFGYTSHGEAGTYPGQTAPGYPSQLPPQTAAAAAASAAAAGVPQQPQAYHARFPYSVYQPVPAAAAAAAQPQAAAGFAALPGQAAAAAASHQVQAAQPTVMSSMAAAMPTSYAGYPTAPQPPPAVTVHQAVASQVQTVAGQAAATAAYYAPRTVSVAGATFSMTDAAGPHFQARPLYSAQTAAAHQATQQAAAAAAVSHQVQAAAPTVMSSMAQLTRQPQPQPGQQPYTPVYGSQTAPQTAPPPTATYTYHPTKPAPMYAPPSMQPATSSSWSLPGQPPPPPHRGLQTKTISASNPRVIKPRPPPKPQQLHYCEVCKISCAGPQTYKEHLEGQKHRKKEAANKERIIFQHCT